MPMKTFPRTLLVLLSFLTFTSAVAQQGDTWKTYRNEAGNFSVDMPGEPQTQPVVEDTYNYVFMRPGLAYLVTYAAHKETPVNDENFETYQKAVLMGLTSCTLASDAPSTHPISSLKSHWYRYRCPEGGQTILGNLYWGAHYAYAVLVVYSGNPEPATVRRFTDSFAVLDPNK
jgi:hypothetical protein